MKLATTEHLQTAGNFFGSPEHKLIEDEIKTAIDAVVWPTGSQTFIINPTPKGNGVKPIKEAFVNVLTNLGWEAERRVSVVEGLRAGPVDAVRTLSDGSLFLVEWETGNVSSSHRAINKVLGAVLDSSKGRDLKVVGGALVVPMRGLYKFLTDRIGNYEEISPYFDLWRHFAFDEVTFTVYGVEHDGVAAGVPLITKMTDGRALI